MGEIQLFTICKAKLRARANLECLTVKLAQRKKARVATTSIAVKATFAKSREAVAQASCSTAVASDGEAGSNAAKDKHVDVDREETADAKAGAESTPVASDGEAEAVDGDGTVDPVANDDER